MSDGSTLARFQDAFSRMLRDAGPLPPGLAVYRNTVMKGWVDALEANYPAVCSLVGVPFFREAATVYARLHPASKACLLRYGAAFGDFLAGYEPAAALRYLPGVARLDRCWIESHIAADAPALTKQSFADLSPRRGVRQAMTLHPATRWAWFDDQPVYTIWRGNRPGAVPEDEIEWRGEGALLTRPDGGAVARCALSQAGCLFLDACAAGHAPDTAAAMALEADSRADMAQLLALLLRQGAFTHPHSPT